jgi:ligand-binding sensor domain-containing protein
MRTKTTHNTLLKYLLLILSCGIIFYSCDRQVSVTPPDSPPPSGYIFINTKPAGFQIYLNGREQRRVTPDSIKWLSSGTYQVTLKKDLFRDTSIVVKVVEGIKDSLNIDVGKNPAMLGSILCDSKPEKAEIFINDSSTGQLTPSAITNLIPGIYEIKYHIQNYQDDSSNVVVSSGSQTSVYMTLRDTLLWSQYTTANSGIKTNNLTSIGIDKNNVVWVGTDDGNGVLSFDGKTWGGSEVYPLLEGSKNITYITVDNNNVMYFCTTDGFVSYDDNTAKYYGFRTSGLPNYFIQCITFDNTGNWYIATQGGATKSFGGGSWYTYGDTVVPDENVTSILYDNSGNLWVGMNSRGISVITQNNGQLDWQIVDKDNSHLISDNVRAIAQSPVTGYIWVGFGANAVYGGGLSYFDGSSWHNVSDIPFSSQTNAIYIDKNDTKWVATDQGLVKIIGVSGTTLFDKENTQMDMDDVTGVAGDSKGNIWISTYGGGLIEYKGNN